jgi:hypothetical protein
VRVRVRRRVVVVVRHVAADGEVPTMIGGCGGEECGHPLSEAEDGAGRWIVTRVRRYID